jgi:hypothetical protein
MPEHLGTVDELLRQSSKELLDLEVFLSKEENWHSFWRSSVILEQEFDYESKYWLRGHKWKCICDFDKNLGVYEQYDDFALDFRVLWAKVPPPSYEHVYRRGIYSDPWPVDTLMHYDHWLLLNKLYEASEFKSRSVYWHTMPLPEQCPTCKEEYKYPSDYGTDKICQKCLDQMQEDKRCTRCGWYGHPVDRCGKKHGWSMIRNIGENRRYNYDV